MYAIWSILLRKSDSLAGFLEEKRKYLADGFLELYVGFKQVVYFFNFCDYFRIVCFPLRNKKSVWDACYAHGRFGQCKQHVWCIFKWFDMDFLLYICCFVFIFFRLFCCVCLLFVDFFVTFVFCLVEPMEYVVYVSQVYYQLRIYYVKKV